MENKSRHPRNGVAAIHDLRPAVVSDLTQIARMAQEALPEAWPLSVLESSLQCVHHHLMIVEATQPNIVAGYYLASRVDHDTELLQLVVMAGHRRQKIASRLLRHLISGSTTNNQITLEVRASNQAAITLYQRHGFAQIAIRTDYYRPIPPNSHREDAVIMQYRCL